jgi:hypothetical protein
MKGKDHTVRGSLKSVDVPYQGTNTMKIDQVPAAGALLRVKKGA